MALRVPNSVLSQLDLRAALELEVSGGKGSRPLVPPSIIDPLVLGMSVELFLPAQHEAAQAVWRQAVDGAEGTWRKRCEAWRTWFAIDVSKSATYINLKPFIDVRNALAHGLGSLTRLQLGKDNGANVRTALGAAGVPMDGNRIVLDGATVQRCVGAGVAHISWLDRECAARGLRQRGRHAPSLLFDE